MFLLEPTKVGENQPVTTVPEVQATTGNTGGEKATSNKTETTTDLSNNGKGKLVSVTYTWERQY